MVGSYTGPHQRAATITWNRVHSQSCLGTCCHDGLTTDRILETRLTNGCFMLNSPLANGSIGGGGRKREGRKKDRGSGRKTEGAGERERGGGKERGAGERERGGKKREGREKEREGREKKREGQKKERGSGRKIEGAGERERVAGKRENEWER